MRNAVIVSSLGATTYVVFARPDSVTAKPRNVIGGHLVGAILGSLFSLIPTSSFLASISVYSIAIGISIFIMVVFDFEHPPAIGTTLGIIINGFSYNLAVTVVASAIMLSLAHFFLKPCIKDLT
ncbi:MAG: HPP family protein [Halobacteriota archaeon]|nr:HPP family protein [Halobacteriota archaeon]